MRNSLLITTAAAALLMASYAAAQNMPKGGQGQGAPPAATQTGPSGGGTGGAGMNAGGGNAPGGAASDQSDGTKGAKGASEESHPGKKGQKTGQEQPKKGNGQTTGQNDQKKGGDRTTTGQNPDKAGGQATEDRGQGAGTRTGQGDRRETTGNNPRGGHVSAQISGEQKTRIRTTVFKGHPNRVTNVTFSLSVGTKVPRSNIHLVAVPEEVVEIVPDYQGFLYFVVNDEIVIVDPETYEIVDVIAA
jgi:Protein of unknown function (DUF1236)